MYDSVMSFLAVASMALAAFGVGRVALRTLRRDEDDPLEIAVWSLALGLVVVGSFLMVLGLAGLLDRTFIGVFTMAASFWGIGELLRAHAGLSQRFVRWPTHDKDDDRAAGPWNVSMGTIFGVWILAAVVVGCRFLAALAPPTDAAALHEHLEIPKTWLLEKSLVYLPSNGDTRLAPAGAMWRVWALALDGGVAAQLVDWALGLLLALATVVLARPIVGRQAAWMSGATVLLVPAIAHDMALARDGLAAAVLATLSLAAWRRATFDDDSRGWFIVAGVLLAGLLDGSAACLSLFASVALVSVYVLWRSPVHRDRMLGGFAMMTAATAVVAAPVLVRAIECGLRAGPEFTAVVDQSIVDERVRDFGFIFLVAAPGLLIARRLCGLGLLLALTGGYVLFAVVLARTNFLSSLLPIVSVLAVALAWTWCEWRRLPRVACVMAHASLLVVLVAGAAAAVLDARDKWHVALGKETRTDYLLKHEPTYNAAMLLNQLAPKSARLLSEDPRSFYFNCRVTQASDLRWNSDGNLSERALAPDDLTSMRAAGFTHALLVTSSHDSAKSQSDSSMEYATYLRAWAAGIDRLQEYELRNSDSASRRYSLYLLR